MSEADLQAFTRLFFERIWQAEAPAADCLLFDTTNYNTYMASQTESELAKLGKNKIGKHHLRQIGLGLLVVRDSRLPLHYSVHSGNLNDSEHFEAIVDEMFGIVGGLRQTKERLTVAIDKGMSADDNYARIDDHVRMHFITTYSTYFAQELAARPLVISDNTDWLTGDILGANLARWQVEDRFRLSKDDDLVGTSPVRHWTDSKIWCHLFTCVVALTFLRRIELRMTAAGVKRSIEDIMADMHHLQCVLTVKKGSRKPERRLETPSKTQAEVLSAFGHHVDDGGVLESGIG